MASLLGARCTNKALTTLSRPFRDTGTYHFCMTCDLCAKSSLQCARERERWRELVEAAHNMLSCKSWCAGRCKSTIYELVVESFPFLSRAAVCSVGCLRSIFLNPLQGWVAARGTLLAWVLFPLMDATCLHHPSFPLLPPRSEASVSRKRSTFWKVLGKSFPCLRV